MNADRGNKKRRVAASREVWHERSLRLKPSVIAALQAPIRFYTRDPRKMSGTFGINLKIKGLMATPMSHLIHCEGCVAGDF